VWDAGADTDPNVVEVYVGYLRRKIDQPFGRHSLQTVRGAGYRLVDDSLTADPRAMGAGYAPDTMEPAEADAAGTVEPEAASAASVAASLEAGGVATPAPREG